MNGLSYLLSCTAWWCVSLLGGVRAGTSQSRQGQLRVGAVQHCNLHECQVVRI